MADHAAVRDALQGVQAAFDAAARRRLALVRRLAVLEVAPADAPALRALVEALVRREAADADEGAELAVRVRAAAAQALTAAAARERLAGNAAVQALAGELDATWEQALAHSERLAAGLAGRSSAAVAAAFADYVVALRALHALGPAPAAGEVDAAVAGYEAALARLEAALTG